jgi:septal ring factor EnvC (AmiA/AmiB activator)
MDEMYNYLLKRIKEVEKERDAYKTASNAAEQTISDIRGILANIPTQTYDGRVKSLRDRQEYALSKIIHIVYPEGMMPCADLFYDDQPQLKVMTR